MTKFAGGGLRRGLATGKVGEVGVNLLYGKVPFALANFASGVEKTSAILPEWGKWAWFWCNQTLDDV